MSNAQGEEWSELHPLHSNTMQKYKNIRYDTNVFSKNAQKQERVCEKKSQTLTIVYKCKPMKNGKSYFFLLSFISTPTLSSRDEETETTVERP